MAKEYGYLATLVAIALNMALTALLFEYSHILLKLIGRRGAQIATKFIGLILIAMGVEFIRSVL